MRKTRTNRAVSADRPVTAAKQMRAIQALRKDGGAHISKPANGLIQDTPAQTIEKCKGVVRWLAGVVQPFSGGALDAAEAGVLHFVADALDHAEQVVRAVGALSDVEVHRG